MEHAKKIKIDSFNAHLAAQPNESACPRHRSKDEVLGRAEDAPQVADHQAARSCLSTSPAGKRGSAYPHDLDMSKKFMHAHTWTPAKSGMSSDTMSSCRRPHNSSRWNELFAPVAQQGELFPGPFHNARPLLLQSSYYTPKTSTARHASTVGMHVAQPQSE